MYALNCIKQQSGIAGLIRLAGGLILAGGLVSNVMANPTGPNVAAGSVSFASPGAGILEITNSPGSVINWNDFSIGANEITRFLQQGSASSILNRVTGGNPSQILGQLLSNGQVWLINSNGIAFGSSAIVDTSGFVASTLAISDQDYLSGNFAFGNGEKTGAIVNQGLIKTGPNGNVVLIAPNIENSGIIQSDGGDLILAAGRKVNIASLDYQNITFEIQSPEDSVTNLGALLSSGGAVAAYAGQLNQSGTIEANKISLSDDGTILLVADKNQVSGNISAKGAAGTTGGTVHILGDQITLTAANIDASGNAGGGEVLIGGDYQGGGAVKTATRTVVDPATSVNASANIDGNGGTIIVWSDDQTDSFGKLVATGGSLSGDGGLIETSGHNTLNFGQPADVSAVNGKPGTWLLDPSDINIGSGEAASISTALNTGSSVEIKTSDSGDGEGNIALNGSIAKTEGGDASLSLQAHNRIDINGSISSTSNKLNVSLVAGAEINVNGSIQSNGGAVSTKITGVAASPVPESVEDPELSAATEPEVVVEGIPSPDPVVEASEPATPVTESTDPAPQVAAVVEMAPEVIAVADSTPDMAALPVLPEPVQESAAIPVSPVMEGVTPVISVDGSIVTIGGDIQIHSGETGNTTISGVLDASSLETGQSGGNIHVLGNEVKIIESAEIDASSDIGGGEILIGGDFQGTNDDIHNAIETYVGQNVSIKSNAVTAGDGGKVIVWADKNTAYYGAISATGGAESGDGGLAEVSGKQNLGFHGQVDLSAANGETGSLLLDPVNAILGLVGTDDANLDPPNGDTTIHALDPALAPPDMFISVTAVENALAVANTFINASVDIQINEIIAWASNFSLSLTAGNDIILANNGELNNTGNGGVFIYTSAGGKLDVGAGRSITAGSGIRIFADEVALDGTLTSGFVVQISPSDENLNSTIGLGDGAGATGLLNLSDTELDNISAGFITIGGANVLDPGTINVDTASVNTDFILSGDTINILGGGISVDGDFRIFTNTNTREIGIGGAAALTGEMDLTAMELGLISLTNGSLTIGSSGAGSGGDISLGAVTLPFSTRISGGDVVSSTGVVEVTGAGNNLSIFPQTANTSMGIGDMGLGDFTLNEAQLQNLRAAGNLNLGIGSINGTGIVDIGNANLGANPQEIVISGSSVDSTAATTGLQLGTGNITYVDSSAGGTIGIGSGSFGTFNISSSALANLSTSGRVTIGDSDIRDVDIDPVAALDLSTENYFLVVNGDNIAVGEITVGDQGVQLSANGSITDKNGATNNVTGGLLALNATNGIDLDTSVSDLARASNINGSIDIANSGALTIGSVGVNNTNGGGTISASSPLTISANVSMGDDFSLIAGDSVATGDDLTINNINITHTGGGTINLTAGDNVVFNVNGGVVTSTGGTVNITADNEGDGVGAIADSTMTVDVIADTLMLNAATGISLDTTVTTFSAVNRVGGNIDVSGNIRNVSNAVATGGNVTISSTNNLGIDTVTAAGNRVAISSSGFATDTNGELNNITAQSAVLTAFSSFSVDTNISQLDIAAPNGSGVLITNSGDLELADLGGGDGLALDSSFTLITVVDGSLVISDEVNVNSSAENRFLTIGSNSVDDHITVNANVVASGFGGLNFLSADDIIINNAQIIHTIGRIGLTADFNDADDVGSIIQSNAGGGIITNNFLVANANSLAPIILNNPNNSINALNISQGNVVEVTVAGGIRLQSTTANGNFTLNAGGAITQAGGTALNITGNASFIANSGNSDITLTNNLNNFGSVTFRGSAVSINEASDFQLAGNNTASTSVELFSMGSVSDGAGQISAPSLGIESFGDIIFDNPANTVDTFAANSQAAGNIVLSDSGTLSIGTVGNIAGIRTLDGDIGVSTGDTIFVDNEIDAGGEGNVNLLASMGDIELNADIASTDDAVGDGAGMISLTAPTGSIIQSAGILRSNTGGAVLMAAADIGTAGNPLQTEVANVTAISTVAGDIFINEFNGITLSNVVTTGSDINITAGGTINANSLTAGGAGSVFLTSTAGNINVGLITAPANITLTTPGGSIQDLNDDLIQDLVFGGLLALNGPVGGASPGGALIDPNGIVEFPLPPVVPLPPAQMPTPVPGPMSPPPMPLPPPFIVVVDPELPALPESIPEEIAQSLSDDIVNEILTLEDVLVKLGLQNRDAEDEGEISFVKKTMQCI